MSVNGVMTGRVVAVVMVLIIGIGTLVGSTTNDLRKTGTALQEGFREKGNAMLYFDGGRKVVVLDFSEEAEPINMDPSSPFPDSTFWTAARIQNKFGVSGLRELKDFKVLCGKAENETSRTTTVVFRSGDNLTGTSRMVVCGGRGAFPEGYETAGEIGQSALSFCVFTDKSPKHRIDRCKRIDSAFPLGYETSPSNGDAGDVSVEGSPNGPSGVRLNGAACDRDSQCQSGLCSTVTLACSQKGITYQRCRRDVECNSNKCTTNDGCAP